MGLGLGVDLAVGAHLAAYSFTLKTKPTSPFDPRLEQPLQEKLKFEPLEKSKEWDEGVQYASAQNLARTVCFYFLTNAYLVWDLWITGLYIVDGATCEYAYTDGMYNLSSVGRVLIGHVPTDILRTGQEGKIGRAHV